VYEAVPALLPLVTASCSPGHIENYGWHHVHPRIRNKISNIGIGMPISQSNIHPTAPRSVLRIALLPYMQVDGRGPREDAEEV
jgi:hypothetical protein